MLSQQIKSLDLCERQGIRALCREEVTLTILLRLRLLFELSCMCGSSSEVSKKVPATCDKSSSGVTPMRRDTRRRSYCGRT
jgi:hypothetical protein